MDKDMPADWAIGRACELADCRSMKEDIVRKHETHWGEGAVCGVDDGVHAAPLAIAANPSRLIRATN